VTELVPFDRLVRFVATLFAASGCEEAEARTVAHALAESNLLGHDSHGVLRVPIYLDHLDKGIVLRGQQPQLVSETGALSTFDGRRGFGQVAGEVIVRHGVARARQLGTAAIALRNVGHLGRLGRWAEMAAAEGILSMQFVNTSGGADAEVMLVAPFGGRDRRMSVNPMCVGLPRRGQKPVIMDATIAATAGGKVMAAFNRGDDLPAGKIIDRDGRPSTRPKDLSDGGAILPFGDHRGYALAFMIDVLAGALTGGGTSSQPKHPRMNNLAAILIDPAQVDGADFDGDLGAYAAWIKAAPSATADGEVMLPGEIELRVAEERRRDGIPLDDTTLGHLQAAATRLKAPQLNCRT
jgi:hydroxycarboxylate dehydrogenase B